LISLNKLKNIFPGYLMIIAGAIVCYWGAGIYVYSVGNYLTAFSKSFGWTRAQISLASSFNSIASGVQGTFTGIIIDKFGPRITSFIGFTLVGLGFCLMYFVNSLWMFYVFWLIAGAGYTLGALPSLNTAVANWFVKKRGLMISLMLMGLCFSGPTMVPFTAWLIQHQGWRNAFLFAGIVTLCVALPLNWFFIKPRRPEYYGWLPDGKRVDKNIVANTEAVIKAGIEYAASGNEVEFTVRQALKDKTIWIIAISSALGLMSFSALSLHTIPYLTDMGIDPIVAAVAMGTSVFMRLPTQLLFGWLGDRVPKNHLRYWGMFGNAISALGLFLFTRATSMAWVWAYAVIAGLGNGATMGMMTPIFGRYWGRKAFATIGGITAPFGMIAGIIAPVYAGWAFDTTGSYRTAFTLILIFSIIGAVMLYFATPPKQPEKITSVTDVV
jgi:MFS family permease